MRKMLIQVLNTERGKTNPTFTYRTKSQLSLFVCNTEYRLRKNTVNV